MRVTKTPEERKQEILDTAMRLFGERGYEKTSTADIAREVGVAQGLCYRYFSSKEVLFDSAIEQYASLLVDKLSKPTGSHYTSLKQLLEEMPDTVEINDNSYYIVFHKTENKKFHDQLALKVCEKMVPIVVKLLQYAKEKGEIQVDDLQAVASFCVYGQLGILLNPELKSEEKGKQIRSFLVYALRLS